LRGRLGKKEMSKWKKWRKMKEGGFGGLTFLHNTKPSLFRGTKKIYWRRVFGGFGGLIRMLQI